MNEEKEKPSEFVAFRCPTELFNQILKDKKNKSKVIIHALESFESREFREDLLKSYLQIIKLFKKIYKHFIENNNNLSLEELGEYIKIYISEPETIDKMNSILGID